MLSFAKYRFCVLNKLYEYVFYSLLVISKPNIMLSNGHELTLCTQMEKEPTTRPPR